MKASEYFKGMIQLDPEVSDPELWRLILKLLEQVDGAGCICVGNRYCSGAMNVLEAAAKLKEGAK